MNRVASLARASPEAPMKARAETHGDASPRGGWRWAGGDGRWAAQLSGRPATALEPVGELAGRGLSGASLGSAIRRCQSV